MPGPPSRRQVHLATGGEVPDQPQASDYQPQGTDTQPARLPEGAFVLNRESTQANPELVRELGGTTVPNDPGRVADFSAGKQPAELTPGEQVIAPEVAAAHPDLVREVNAAHGPVKHLAGGGSTDEGTPRKYTTYDLAPPGPVSAGEGASPTDERAHVEDARKLDEQVKDLTADLKKLTYEVAPPTAPTEPALPTVPLGASTTPPPETYPVLPMTAPVPEATLPTVTTPPETYDLAREPESPVAEASQEPLLQDAYESLAEAADKAGEEAARLGKSLPTLGDVIDKAIRDLQAKIHAQGTGATPEQKATLANLQGLGQGKVALTHEDRSALEQRSQPTASTEQLVRADNANALTRALQKVQDAFAGIGKSLGQLTAAGASAFVPLAAGMTGLAKAASPALFDTLSKSFQLLGATVGTAVIGPVLTLSFKVQELAGWVHNLDPALKSQIGSWLGWATATTGAFYALGKITGLVGNVLPALAALKSALVFTVANPFGMIVAGLGALAAFHPEAFAGIGKAIQEAFGSTSWTELLKSGVEALRALADVAAGILGPALSGVAAIIRVTVAALQTLGGMFGATSAQTMQFVAATALLIGPVRLAVNAFLAFGPVLLGFLGNLRAVMAGTMSLSAAFGMGTAAATGFKAALAGTGIGLLVVGISAAVAALLSMSGAFGIVGTKIAEAQQKIERLQAKLLELQGGGKPKVEDVGEALPGALKTKYGTAKTPEERRKILEEGLGHWQEKLKGGIFSGTKPEQIERAGVGIKGILEGEINAKDITKEDRERTTKWMRENIGFSFMPQGVYDSVTRANLRRERIVSLMKDAGLSNEESVGAVNTISKDYSTRRIMGKEKLDEKDINTIAAALKLPAIENFSKIEVLKKALAGGVEAPGGAGGEKDYAPKGLRDLLALQGKYGMMAFPKENQPTRTAAENVRAQRKTWGWAKTRLTRKSFGTPGRITIS